MSHLNGAAGAAIADRVCFFSTGGLIKSWDWFIERELGDKLPTHEMLLSFLLPRDCSLLRKTGYVEQPLRQVLVSKVVGSTIGQPNGSIHLKGDKVEILLSTLNLDLYDVDELSAKCVYWDVSTQEWSTDGCELVSTNGKIISGPQWARIFHSIYFYI